MIKKSNLFGMDFIPFSYEMLIANTGGAFVGMVDENNQNQLKVIRDCFQGTMATFPIENMPKHAEIGENMKPMIFLAPELMTILNPQQLLFIMYHEQGHIVLNHQEDMFKNNITIENKPYEMAVRHEVEADEYGMRKAQLDAEDCIEALMLACVYGITMGQKATGAKVDKEDITNFVMNMFEDKDNIMCIRANHLRNCK